jgi:hypothetical protein
MVNEVIVNYLKQTKDNFPLEIIKKKILDSGYLKKDLEEALAYLGLPIDKLPEIALPNNNVLALNALSNLDNSLKISDGKNPFSNYSNVANEFRDNNFNNFKDQLAKNMEDKEEPKKSSSKKIVLSLIVFGFLAIVLVLFFLFRDFSFDINSLDLKNSSKESFSVTETPSANTEIPSSSSVPIQNSSSGGGNGGSGGGGNSGGTTPSNNVDSNEIPAFPDLTGVVILDSDLFFENLDSNVLEKLFNFIFS